MGPNDAARSSGVATGTAARTATRSGWSGASGATTSSVVCSRGRRVASSATASTRCARLAHEVPEHLGVRGSRLQQSASVSQERVARLDGLDLGERAVGLLGVAAGVAPETHGAKVEERGPPGLTHVLDGLADRAPDLVDLAVRQEVRQVRLRSECVRRSSPRGSAR